MGGYPSIFDEGENVDCFINVPEGKNVRLFWF